MNLEELKQLLQLLDEREIAEFELEEGNLKVRVRKAAHQAAPGAHIVAPSVPLASVAAAPPAAVATPVAASPARAAEVVDDGIVAVKSPIVGTFYRSPDPNSPPFVDVGDRIRVGQVLCIVEAMKLMNEIEAETAGELVRVHKENGQPVQYGEILFSIRP
ncbi:MAG TPA: acetyl-CoA carboxylase biotin carboxyl carrier protein [Vicinamibacteria bacterium]|nr:acetyl-CoA carboxylase biotin carboxyl carrier protein [Vicinamibacteria bacterium]